MKTHGKIIPNSTETLYRPVGPGQLSAIRRSGWRNFPVRKTHQKFFYPLLYEAHAVEVARNWHVFNSGIGHILEFQMEREYLNQFTMNCIGGQQHIEYRIPAYKIMEFNQHIMGCIKLIASYYLPLVSRDTSWSFLSANDLRLKNLYRLTPR